jgi:hypothetical protein
VAKSKDILWVRNDVLGNSVTLPEWVWAHASKHTFDVIPSSEEHIFQTIIDPDHAHRSLDPIVMGEGCIFEKYFEVGGAQERFFVPVLYDGIVTPEEYDKGGKKGRVMTGYFPGKQNNSKSIGPIFWSKQKPKTGDDSK